MVWCAKRAHCEVKDGVWCCNQKFQFHDLTKWLKCRIDLLGIVPYLTLKGQFYSINNNPALYGLGFNLL